MSTNPIYNPEFGPNIFTEVFAPDKLIAGDFPIITDMLTIAAGQQLLRGSLLGVTTATGYGILALSAANDGSQNPFAILADNIDTSATGYNAATPAPIYLTGQFNVDQMTFGTGFSFNQALKNTLRLLDIFLVQGFGTPQF